MAEKGATYEFKIAAKNAVGYGEYATEVIKTPDGSKKCYCFCLIII